MKTELQIKAELKQVKIERRNAIRKGDYAEAHYLCGVIAGLKTALDELL